MKILCNVLFFSVILSGCGVEKSHHPETPVVSKTNYSNQPIMLKKKSLQCGSRNFTQDESNFALNIFLRGRNFLFEKNFFRFLSGFFLKDGSIISGSSYGEEVEILVTPFGEKIVKDTKGSPVFLCPDEEYESDFIEGAALNIVHYIEKTRDFFMKSSPGERIAPVKVSVSPAIVKTQLLRNFDGEFKKIGHYMTDNALYQPSTKTIAFLPHSEFMKFGGFSMNLWEVPMVPAHEYGHHLLQEILGSQYVSNQLHLNCFGNFRETKSALKTIRPREVKTSDIIRLYHEGFSDLVAHYALSEEERSVSGVKCLEVSRDVRSPKFYDGSPKVFSEEVLHSYFSHFEGPAVACEVTNYQDAHVMGAILAHTYDSFASEFTEANEEKLSALVEWVKYLRARGNHLRKLSPEEFFKVTYRELLKISLKKQDLSFDENTCRKIEGFFPRLNLAECNF